MYAFIHEIMNTEQQNYVSLPLRNVSGNANAFYGYPAEFQNELFRLPSKTYIQLHVIW